MADKGSIVMRIILKTILILSLIVYSLFIAVLAAVYEYAEVHTMPYGDIERFKVGIAYMLGSPAPILYGLTVFFAGMATISLFSAIFKGTNTKTIVISYLIKASILFVLLLGVGFLGTIAHIGKPDITFLVAGLQVLAVIIIFIVEIN